MVEQPTNPTARMGRLTILLAGCVCTALLSVLVLKADSALAAATVESFSNGPSVTQAGGHPDILTSFKVGSRYTQGEPPLCQCADPKDVRVHMPTGVIGNPHVASQCNAAEQATFECPPDAQVGVVAIELPFFGWFVVPLHNAVPHTDQAGLLTFEAPFFFAVPQYLVLEGRTGSDYGLDSTLAGISQIVPPNASDVILWGVPADPVNDVLRFPRGQVHFTWSCDSRPTQLVYEEKVVPDFCYYGNAPADPIEPVPSGLPTAPFIQNPTTCAGPLSTSLEVVSYDHDLETAEDTWPATTGCDLLSFNPSLSAKPTTEETDAPSGLDVTLTVPQTQDPVTPSPSEIRTVRMTLPAGVSLNSNAADGKTSCSDIEASFGTLNEAKCREFSKIGTAVLDSSVLPGPISGAVYIGDPKPGDRYRVILTADGFNTHVKLSGSLEADPVTGRLTAALVDLPQTPFQEFKLHLFGAERGILATPTHCGTYEVRTNFKPWDDALSEQNATQFFTLNEGPEGRPCPSGPRSFNPAFQAGTTDNTAAAYTPFSLQLNREDGDQNMTAVGVDTPPGFLASLRGIPYCPEAAIAQLSAPGYSGVAELNAPSCPVASQIGSTVAGAGAGTRPLYVDGKVYLAGPYKGSPLSLVIAVPAVSGPYDLGNVVIRAAVNVDPVTARVSAISDPVPQILEGVPLRARSILINLDRPGFTLNPTNCSKLAVNAAVAGDEGASSNPSSLFQVSNCRALDYQPGLRMHLSGGLKRRGHPAIHAVFTAKQGESNTSKVNVTLPRGALLDNSHIKTVCTRVAFAADNCPSGSMIGRAEVSSPLLDQPLKGNVYMRSSRHKLPDLVADLNGQVDIELSARIGSVKGRLRARFSSVPDVPVSTFRIGLLGGKKGLVVNSTDVCKTSRQANVRITGQNGVVIKRKPKVGAACGSSRKRHRRHSRSIAGGVR
jgi:hypothetical protein